MLTDTPVTPDDYLSPEQVDEPPIDLDDLGALPDAGADFDDDRLASLTEPEPGEHEPEPGGREDFAPARVGAAQRHVTDLEEDPIAAIHAALDARDEARDLARAVDEHFWATAAVPRDRLVELNSLAEDFFTDHYRDAWAPTYLSDRLGTDLDGDARFSVGYAPARWTALTDHLRRSGATDQEIVGAGLGRVASTGRVIDQFRDRLVFPIKAADADGDPEILGWIGRRNPTKGDDDNAGPKYLNTAETDIFRKGNELYGLAEATPALASGAGLVLVEGPMDAIAVTLAGDGHFVGVAPLGTSFTDTQADKLRPHIGAGKPDPIVATDADAAGQRAAHRAFWQLAARNADPQHLLVPDGKDPAEMLQTAGPEQLHAALSSPTDLADAIIAARLSEYTNRLDTVEGRVFATRRAAEVIAALPGGWIEHIDRLVDQTRISKQTAMSVVIDAVEAWTADPRGLVNKHLAERPQILPTPEPATADNPTSALAADLPPTQRWAALADSAHAGLSDDPYWPALARTIDQAAAGGIDVKTLLPGLLADNPLPDEHPARSLDFRLVDAAGDVTRPRTRTSEPISRGDDKAAARTRRAAADRATADRRGPSAPPAAGAYGRTSASPQTPEPLGRGRR